MELMVNITTLFIGLSILITPSASLQTQQKSAHQQAHDIDLSLITKLPIRKLQLFEKTMVQRYEVEDCIAADYKQSRALSGVINTPSMRDGREGTRQSWVERPDTWQYFTMDYAKVRRRTPMHNKAVSVTVRP